MVLFRLNIYFHSNKNILFYFFESFEIEQKRKKKSILYFCQFFIPKSLINLKVSRYQTLEIIKFFFRLFYFQRTEEISRSLPLTLDTGLALVMVRVPTAQPNKSREITVLDDAKIFTTYLLVDQPIESPFSFESLYDSNKEFVIGSLLVACICIVLLLAYIISKRKSSATDKLPLIDADDVSINCDEGRTIIHV